MDMSLREIFETCLEINTRYQRQHPNNTIRDDLHHIIDEIFEHVEAKATFKHDEMNRKMSDLLIMAIATYVHYWVDETLIIWDEQDDIPKYMRDMIVHKAYNQFKKDFWHAKTRTWEK